MMLRGESRYTERSWGSACHEPSTDRGEEELARSLKARSVDAWEFLFDRHFDRVYRYGLGRLLTREEAEDVAAATFHRALRTIDTYSYQGRPILAWLYGIARNVVQETRRGEMRQRTPRLVQPLLHRKNGHEKCEEPPLLGLHSMDNLVSRMDLEQAMHRLTATQRDVLLLRYFAGLTAAETGLVIGRPETAVYALQARALASLRRHLS
jgi:RNA polymerase sigma-70 factor, ECF subfamily